MTLQKEQIASGEATNPYSGWGDIATRSIGFGSNVAEVGKDSFRNRGYEVNSSPSLNNRNLSLDTNWFRDHLDNAGELRLQRKGAGARNSIQLGQSGAGLGASIGTAIAPGVGTIIGGAIGAGAGAITGALFGKRKRKKLKRAAREIDSSAKDELGSYLGNYNSRASANAYASEGMDRYNARQQSYNPDSIYL